MVPVRLAGSRRARAWRERESAVLGVDRPSLGWAGLLDVGLLDSVAAQTTTFTSADNGRTIYNRAYNQLKFNGCTGMRFVNCMAQGLSTTPSSDGEVIIATNAANYGNTWQDGLIQPQNPYWLSRAVRGHGLTFLRSEARHLTDGYAVINSAGYAGTVAQNAWWRQSWMHDYWLASPDPGAAGGVADNMSHVDIAMQASGGTDMGVVGCEISGTLGAGLEGIGTQITSFSDQTPLRVGSDAHRMSRDVWVGGIRTEHLDGNKYFSDRDASGNLLPAGQLLFPYPLYAQATSLIMLSPSIGDISDIIIDRNWMNGGAVGINLNDYSSSGQPTITGRITDNQVGPPDGSGPPVFRTAPTAFIINQAAVAAMTVIGNRRTDTGASLDYAYY
jgi:hypothetical protein